MILQRGIDDHTCWHYACTCSTKMYGWIFEWTVKPQTLISAGICSKIPLFGLIFASGELLVDHKKMKNPFAIFLLCAVSFVMPAAELQVEIDPLPDWQKPMMSKVTFDVQIRTLNQILGKKADTGQPTFLVFTAATSENLGKRLLWINGEVELSDGRKVEFKSICFHLLSDGVEADIQKLDSVDSVMPSDILGNESPSAPLEARKLRIKSATWK